MNDITLETARVIDYWTATTAKDLNSKIKKAFPALDRFVKVTPGNNAYDFDYEDCETLFSIDNPSWGSLSADEALEYASALTFAAGLIKGQVAGMDEAIASGVPLEDVFAA